MTRLPTKYREVIVLHYLEENNINVVAELLKIKRNTADVRLSRARRKLINVFRSMGIDESNLP